MNKTKKDSFIKRLIKIFGFGEQNNLRENIQYAIEENFSNGSKGSGLSNKEKTILENILTINKLKAGDIMIPRADIVSVGHNSSFGDLIKFINKESHSRIPIFRKDLDDVLGMVHIKDLIKFINQESQLDFVLKNIIRNVLFIPPSMPILNILLKMQSTKLHMALVIDEHGGTDGLITIEDLVEEIVGEIQDEHDEEDVIEFKTINEKTFIANAKMELIEFQKKTNINFDADNVDTLGGYIFSIINRVPQKGEIIKNNPKFIFEIMDADPRKIKVLKITKS
jgi:magnesium and cobalt transporter